MGGDDCHAASPQSCKIGPGPGCEHGPSKGLSNSSHFLEDNGFPLWTGLPHESARKHVHDVLLAAVSSFEVGFIEQMALPRVLASQCVGWVE